jgi:thioredoxin-like negative regulator of GroEL
VLQIRGYPTLKVIVNGSEFKAFKGARDLDSLTTFIKEAAKEALTETTE